jgi:hypothetical protein
VERDDVEVAQPAGHRTDLPGARQEHQQVARGLGMRAPYDRGDVVEQPGVDAQAVRRRDRRARRAPHGLHRVQGTGGRDDRHPAELLGDAFGLRGRRHGEQQQVRAQRRPDVDAEGQREVGVQVPLVALVEHDGAGPGQLRVALQPTDEDAGRHHLDAGGRADGALAADRVPDRPTRPLAEQRAHPPGGGAGRHAPRLGDHHAAIHQPGEGQRDERGLARARRCDEDGRTGATQGLRQLGQHRPDREVGAGRADRGQHPVSLPDGGPARWRYRRREDG